MNAMFSRVFFYDSITAVLKILSWHGFKAKKNLSGHYEIRGGHRLYSSIYSFNGQHQFRDGVPRNAMSFIELNTRADNFQDLQDIIEEHLAQIRSEEEAVA